MIIVITHEINKTGYKVNAVNDIERYLSYQMNNEKHLEIIMRIYENFMLHTWIYFTFYITTAKHFHNNESV